MASGRGRVQPEGVVDDPHSTVELVQIIEDLLEFISIASAILLHESDNLTLRKCLPGFGPKVLGTDSQSTVTWTQQF